MKGYRCRNTGNKYHIDTFFRYGKRCFRLFLGICMLDNKPCCYTIYSIKKIKKEFRKLFVIPDTKERDVSFWEETTPKEVIEFLEKSIDKVIAEKDKEIAIKKMSTLMNIKYICQVY
jgi:hypothetical protein